METFKRGGGGGGADKKWNGPLSTTFYYSLLPRYSLKISE